MHHFLWLKFDLKKLLVRAESQCRSWSPLCYECPHFLSVPLTSVRPLISAILRCIGLRAVSFHTLLLTFTEELCKQTITKLQRAHWRLQRSVWRQDDSSLSDRKKASQRLAVSLPLGTPWSRWLLACSLAENRSGYWYFPVFLFLSELNHCW